MEGQPTEGFFGYSIVVVDNDRAESARQIVIHCAERSNIIISYHVEPEQNISRARNRAVENAKGDFVAFIDDDEMPSDNWLLELYRALIHYGSDGVLGPVLPRFENGPPGWVVKGHFFERAAHPTGYILGWKNTRTGNTLLRSELFRDSQEWFDPDFGSGGEDRDFFRRQIEKGRVFVWCDGAPVYETIQPIRWKRKVLIKRALLRGKMALNVRGSGLSSVIKSVVAIAVYTCGLPIFLLLGQHVFMKYLIKNCDHLGKVLAFAGIDLVKEKYVGGS